MIRISRSRQSPCKRHLGYELRAASKQPSVSSETGYGEAVMDRKTSVPRSSRAGVSTAIRTAVQTRPGGAPDDRQTPRGRLSPPRADAVRTRAARPTPLRFGPARLAGYLHCPTADQPVARPWLAPSRSSGALDRASLRCSDSPGGQTRGVEYEDRRAVWERSGNMQRNIRMGHVQRSAAPFGSKPTPDALDETSVCLVVGDSVTLPVISDRAAPGYCDGAGNNLSIQVSLSIFRNWRRRCP